MSGFDCNDWAMQQMRRLNGLFGKLAAQTRVAALPIIYLSILYGHRKLDVGSV